MGGVDRSLLAGWSRGVGREPRLSEVLVKKAFDAGSDDNITAAVIQFV